MTACPHVCPCIYPISSPAGPAADPRSCGGGAWRSRRQPGQHCGCGAAPACSQCSSSSSGLADHVCSNHALPAVHSRGAGEGTPHPTHLCGGGKGLLQPEVFAGWLAGAGRGGGRAPACLSAWAATREVTTAAAAAAATGHPLGGCPGKCACQHLQQHPPTAPHTPHARVAPTGNSLRRGGPPL